MSTRKPQVPRRRGTAAARKTVGAELLKQRHKLGLTQIELADAAMVSVNSISNIENDNRKPRYTTLVLLCDALGLAVDSLAKLNGYMG